MFGLDRLWGDIATSRTRAMRGKKGSIILADQYIELCKLCAFVHIYQLFCLKVLALSIDEMTYLGSDCSIVAEGRACRKSSTFAIGCVPFGNTLRALFI